MKRVRSSESLKVEEVEEVTLALRVPLIECQRLPKTVNQAKEKD